MFHNSKTKGHGSIRKNKVYGTIGILTLGTIAILSAHQGVAADEVKATKPTTPAPVAEASDTSLAAQSKAAATEAASSSTAAITTAKAETTAPAGAISTADTTTASATTTTESAATQPATAPVASTTPAATTATPETTPAPATTAKAEATTPAPAGAVSTSDPVATPVDRTEGSKVTVENQKLKDAISEANGYNIDVKQNQNDNIGTANNQVESDAKKDLANTLEETQATRIKTGVDAYKRDLKKAQANTGTPGYLSEVVSQGLKFEREPNAKLSITGTTEFGQKDMNNMSYEEYVKSGGTFANNPIPAFTTRLSAGGSRFVIPKIKSGQTITATYTGLQNSKYNGVSISKVTYEVTNLNPKTGIVGFAEKDPTRGIYTFYDINVPSRYKVVARFYDADGNVINFKKDNPAILALTSLTKTEPKTGKLAGLKHEESITDYNFRPVKITGSLVEKQTDGRLAANIVTDGIKDDYDDPNFYKMGIAGVAESGDSISFVMQRTTQWDRGYWLAITSKLPSRFTLVKPDLEYNLVEYNLAGNVLLDNYIQGTTTKLTNTQTVKPTGTPVGEDYTTTHQDRITTADGKIYKYVSSTNNTTGKVKLGTTNVANYYTEVKGNVVVDYQDKQGNTLSPRIVDTPDTSVGTAYDTTDHKPSTITTADGASYRIDPTATQGKESGRVVEGTTRVVYVYDKLEKPVEKYGNVVVDYQDKQGNTIAPRIVDTPTSRVGTYYDTTDHKPTTITADDGTTYRIDTNATQGHESGQVVEGTTRVVYVYDKVEKPVEKKYGDVTVEYKNKDGVTIAPKVTDTPRSEVGTDYDTKDQRKDTITTVDGKKYKLDLTATQGAETGKVVEGNTNIVYYYDLVPDIPTPEKKYGDVTVEYKNKDGMTISPKVTDTPRSEVGTDYDTTDQRKETITTVDGKKYKLDLKATQGAETGKVVEGNTNITYYYDLVPDVPTPDEYGNVVVDYQDKKGNTIAPRVVDTPDSKVGTNYDTTDHKPTRITTADGKVYRIDTKATQGQESGKIVKGTTRVVYVYDEVLGDVTVHYKDEDGKVIKEPEKDTTGATINTVYDTRDHAHKTITTKDGRTYEIVPEKTQGLEQGRVVEGNTDVTYIYKQVFGDVVVHYEDESGKKIKEDVTDTSHAKVGENYDTTDHKTTAIKSGDKVYNLVPEKTKGNEKGKVTKGVTEVTYVYKEVKAEPTKKGTNAKGEDVNGKTMLAGSTEIYTINIDNDQYKGLTGVTEKDKQAGLMLVEKYSGKYVTPNLAGVRVTTEDGKVQSGFTTKIYKSLAEAPQKVQDYIKAKGLQIDGEFAVTTSDDPVAYTNNYVLKGINLKLIFPTTVKKDIKDASKYDNKAYQIDFTGIHDTNLVTNNIPKINPKKDVVATVEDGQKDQNSLSGKTVKVGQVYNFELETSYLPANRGQAIEKMEVKDTYSPLVEYNGVHKWFAKTDLLLKDGTRLAKGTDLTQYVSQTIDHKSRTVVYSFSSDFLSKISDNSEFQATGYMQVKQLNTGTVKNTFTEIINNVERDSNTVTVDSPQDYGDVVVHYVDESGKKIKEDVTDTSHSKVGENYDTTDHKTTAIKSGDKVYNLVPEKTKGNEKGKVTKGVTEVTYVYKEVKAEPTKKGTNAKGEDVNGKTMLAGSTEIYTINIDNDQYKGLTGVTEKDKQAGLMLVEKYSGKYVTPNLAGVRVTTEDGKVQSGFTTKIYKSLAEAPQKVQDYIKAKGLQIDGEFAVTTSDDPVAYTNNYVLKGINLKLIFPTTVKKDIKDASKYDNKAYQIDFTGIHDTNLVTNNIPKINPKKDVVATVEDGQKDQNSLSGKTVKVGQVYNFELETSYLPANRGQAIEKMEVKDTYSPLVEYNGVYKWFAKTDILLKNGQKIAKGTDLTKFVNQTVDHKTRTVVYSFSSAFLNSISDNSEFQATGYMQVKQLDYGTVKNTFTEIINGVERNSNTVTVVTPDKPKTPDKPQTPPETPKTPEKPQTPPTPTPTPVVPTTPKQPVTPQVTLPSTGEATNDGAALVGLAFAATALSMLGFKKRKEEE
ncbi:SspB-related isopeptide-forming adhesin [Streptococcus anginosus]|uniref:MucBP domain-containing protein n=2 Tax=Streptococcus anginosus TaxID=1328 RepID=A0AAP6EMU2_STRAP|nr:SspB-related isopeptide-forming adhesin [Streptococcus anginosus]MDX5040610.1 MucBP domain-containing protein [Streptococcus anginosus]